mmetsp:Transcript_30521/g.66973  ORF Transcript_30521/g.66973 Transcript_30521/m.66973 type:complete len:236 (-) Transcript_30521:1192-1899(-)
MICLVDLKILQSRVKLLLIGGLGHTRLNLHLCKIRCDRLKHPQDLGATTVGSRVAGIPGVRLGRQFLQELPVFLGNLARPLVKVSQHMLRVGNSSLRFLGILDINSILFAVLSPVRLQLSDVSVQVFDVGVVVGHFSVEQFNIGGEFIESVVKLCLSLRKFLLLLLSVGDLVIAPIFVLLFLLLLILQLEDHFLDLLFHLVERTTRVLAVARRGGQSLSRHNQTRQSLVLARSFL